MLEEFKRANDSVHADADLADRIIAKHRELQAQENAKNVHNKPLFPLKRKLPALAAAAVVISTSLTLLPKLTDKSTNDIIYTTQSNALPTAAADENTSETDISTTVISDTADTADTTAAAAPVSDTAKSNAAPIQTAAPETASVPIQTYTPKATPVPIQTAQPETGRSYSFESENAEAPEYSFESEHTKAAKPKELVLSFNSPQAFNYTAAADYLGGELFAGDLSYADWTYAMYFAYMGTDFNSWLIPRDLVLLGHSEDLLNESFGMALDTYGKPTFDTRIFAFEGENARYLSLQTSKDINSVTAYLSDAALTKSRIGETDAVIVGTAESWRCYLIYGGTAFTITGDNITENELKELLCSIVQI